MQKPYGLGARRWKAGPSQARGRGSSPARYRSYGKRILDLSVVLLSAPVVVPVALAVAGVVGLKMGFPVLFAHQRPGLRGKPFCLLKFRTMRETRDTEGQPLPDALRLTPFGRELRSTSLDELPSLWNVLRGEMSLVGPRPLLMEYLPLFNARQARRHDMRPGVTGWAQVNGRNALSWEEKLEMDVWYVENVSLKLDLRILARTLLSVVRRTGISAPGEATMPRFTGSAP